MSEHTHEDHSASSTLFDLRMIIAILFWIYGIVLVIMGFGTSDEDLDRAGGLNLNLWSGVGMLILAAAFTAWTLLRPLRLPDADEIAAAEADGRPRH